MRRLTTKTLALGVLLGAGACAGSHVSLSGEVKYGATAEDDYKAGVDEMKDKNWAESVKFFEHVRNKYPYSKYAALAELKLADSRFEQEKFIEAADAYKTFVKLHPTHEDVDYAAYRIGLSYFREAPGDFFLFPPSFERDQSDVKTAIEHLKDFLKSYPNSKHVAEAQQTLQEAREKLADHEWYVASFYFKRQRWAGAAGRLAGLVRDYPNTRHEGEALWKLAQAYLEMNERFRAQQALQQLIVKHPNDPRRAAAERELASLR